MKKNALLLISTGFLLLCNGFESALATEIIVTSTPRTIFSAKANHCNPNFIPDSPARVFRRADGNLALIAAHYDNWMMVGRDFNSLKLVCRSIFPADRYSKRVPGHLWIQSTYTQDGKEIYGLASQDLTIASVACGCNTKVAPGHCWVNQIMAVRSVNMGNDFGVGPVIASFGDTYPPTMQHQFGFFSTTNIVRKGDCYYVLIFLTPPDPKLPSGDCLFATKTPNVANTWRGWNGSQFGYRASVNRSVNNNYSLVTPPEFGIVRSIEYIAKKNEYVALAHGTIRLPSDHKPVPGFYSMTSSDLIHWHSLTRVIKLPMTPRVDDFNDIYNYPSLIDPQSRSRNFETIDHDKALLVFVHHHLNHGNGTMNRDLECVEVSVK